METRFTILLVEMGILTIVQVGVLIGIYMVVKKSSDKMTSLAEQLHQRTVPILEAANAMVATTKPQIETIVSNLTETSETLRSQVDNLNTTVTDIIDRTRLHVVRADEIVSRTMDRVEETTEMIQHTVISPVRQIAGVLQALNIGMNVLFGKRRSGGNGVPRDEMFI